MNPSTWAVGFQVAFAAVVGVLAMAGLEALVGRWRRKRRRAKDEDGFGTGGWQ